MESDNCGEEQHKELLLKEVLGKSEKGAEL